MSYKFVSLPEKRMSKPRACSGNVFMIRDEQESSRSGILISERAQVGSMNGYVAFIDASCECAEDGDRVHIPHFGVQDILWDGVEYANFKMDRLFAKETADGWKPINRYVLVRKCENDHVRDESGEVALYMTKNHIETTNWVEVIDVADDCEIMDKSYIGLFTPAPESDDRLARIGETADYCLHEELIEFLTDGE